MKVLVVIFDHLSLVFFLLSLFRSILFVHAELGEPNEVSDILRQNGELTNVRLSKDTNNCLKESLNSESDELFIHKLMTTSSVYETAITWRRRQATLELARAALALTTEGDFVETGLYTGGSAGAMLLVLLKYDNCGRKFYGYDSFEGLPENAKEDVSKYGSVFKKGDFTTNKDKVIASLKKWKVYDENRVFITKGWFNETLPQSPVTKISFLRADGDLYVSTMDALINLYHKVVPGGLIYIDDYGGFPGCRSAVNEFRTKHRIYEPIHFVRETTDMGNIRFEAAWWQKRRRSGSGGHNHRDKEKVHI